MTNLENVIGQEKAEQKRVVHLVWPTDTVTVQARRLWQVLFNEYRSEGQLDIMHAMLVDLDNCLSAVAAAKNEPQQFAWGCAPGDWMTSWLDSHPKDLRAWSNTNGLTRIVTGDLFHDSAVLRCETVEW